MGPTGCTSATHQRRPVEPIAQPMPRHPFSTSKPVMSKRTAPEEERCASGVGDWLGRSRRGGWDGDPPRKRDSCGLPAYSTTLSLLHDATSIICSTSGGHLPDSSSRERSFFFATESRVSMWVKPALVVKIFPLHRHREKNNPNKAQPSSLPFDL